MSPRMRRRTAPAVILGLLAGLVAAFASPTVANAEPYGMTCTLPPALSPDPFQLQPDIDATVPVSVNNLPGATITMTGVTADIVVPGLIVNAGVALGVLPPGGVLSGNVTVRVAGTNTTQATQNAVATGIPLGTVTGTFDAGPDGILLDDPLTLENEGADSVIAADPIISTIVLPSVLNWTPTGTSPATFRADLLNIVATLPGLIVPITCTPGITDPGPDGILNDDPATPAVDESADNGGFITQLHPFASTNVVIPSPIPEAFDDSGTVGANQAITVNVVSNDQDINGDLDPASVAIVTPPTAGTAVPNGDGTVTYTNTNPLATSDSFTYSVNDDALSGTDTATVSITILGNQCEAPCSLSQVADVEVIGDTMTMSQAGQFLSLEDITLNGQPQVAAGNLNDMQVINRRGTDPGWAVTATATDWILAGSGLTDCATLSNKCIPKGNLNWTPSANVGHVVIPGDVAAVTSGPSGSTTQPWVGGFSATKTLCSTVATTSGGTFDCSAGLYLGVPASAHQGNYTATITLTLA